MKILVTGGGGFIGSYIVDSLLDRKDDVIVLDDFSASRIVKKDNPNLKIYSGDVCNKRLVSQILLDEKIEQVYHLASVVGVERVVSSPLHTLQVSLKGITNILECRKDIRLLLTSTSEVYGPFADNHSHKLHEMETLKIPYDLRWSYGLGKLTEEFIALSYPNTTVCRLFNVIGVGQSSRWGMVVPRFIEQAKSNSPITIHGYGTQSRCFADVRDVSETLIDLMDNPNTIEKTLNVGSDVQISIYDLADRIKELTNSSSPIVHSTCRKLDVEWRIPDLERLRLYSKCTIRPLVETLQWMM